MVVGDDLKDVIRSHIDIDKDNCKYSKKAAKVCVSHLVQLEVNISILHLTPSFPLPSVTAL